MDDVQPVEIALKKILKKEGFKKIVIIDKPSLFIAFESK
jgi:hypothetical protein